jgi:3-hydroxybutyrate dehydrogenase
MAQALTGKRALVTGSTSGIGLAMARALAAEGASVMLNGFGPPDAIEAARSAIAADFGVAAEYNGADLSRPEAITELVEDATERLGGIDILVNNAGIQFVSRIEDFPPDRWDAILAINLSSAFHTIRLALPQMRERGWGRIINTASAHGLVASVEKAGYVAAKHGLVGLTKVVGLETAGSGVTCNAICPGWVRTPLVEQQIVARATAGAIPIEESAANLLGEKQPSGSFVTPEQLGKIAVFLCSDAADQMTGAAISVDGGWTAQ